MSPLGQKAKFSRRADVFRCSPNSRHSVRDVRQHLAGLPASIASSACQGMPKPYRIPYNIDADQSSTKDRALRRAAASTIR
jgi:hypothetical protein